MVSAYSTSTVDSVFFYLRVVHLFFPAPLREPSTRSAISAREDAGSSAPSIRFLCRRMAVDVLRCGQSADVAPYNEVMSTIHFLPFLTISANESFGGCPFPC